MFKYRRISLLWAAILSLTVLLAACGDSTATIAPVAATTAASAATTAASAATTAAGATTAAAAGATAAGGPANPAAIAALCEAAKKEGKFTWYTVWFTQEIINDIGTAFTATCPGIKVEGVRNVAATIYQKLTQEMQAGIKNVDVYASTDIGQLIELKEGGKLQAYPIAGKEVLYEEFRNIDPENFYHVGSFVPIIIAYNTQKLKAEDAPKSWQELITDKYKDKITTGSGAASGQVGTWALSMQQKYGWDAYFNKFNSLNPKLGRSINDTVTDLVAGERSVGISPLGQILTGKGKGNPIDAVFPSDGTVIVVNTIGILKDAPNPNAAKLFMNFLMSKEYAEICAKYFEQPIRPDVTVKGGKTYKEMAGYSPKTADIRKDLPDVIKKWKTLFGA